MHYKNLTTLGTSHISRDSIQEIITTIDKVNPTIIAVELDRQRLIALLEKQKNKVSFSQILHIGVKGYLFAVIGGYVQKKLGKIVGVVPGSDMLTAVREAKKRNISLALIDQDISITLRKFSKAFTWREKWRLVVDVIRGTIFRKSEMEKLGLENFDLTKVPSKDLIRKLMLHMKKRYPSIYHVIVFERNHVMAKNLGEIMQKNERVLAVIGAGHEEEIIEIIKKMEVRKVEYV